MSAPWSCGVSTPTFSRKSRNTQVSFTGKSTPVTLGETFWEVKIVSRKLDEVVEIEGRSSQVFSSHSESDLDIELGLLGRLSERGLRIGRLHLVAYGLSPADA
jgi:hypothetical protein